MKSGIILAGNATEVFIKIKAMYLPVVVKMKTLNTSNCVC